VINCTKGHLSYIDTLELKVNQWLAQSLQRIAEGEKQTCQLILGLNSGEEKGLLS